MSQSFLFALVIVAALAAIVISNGIPEKFYVIREPMSESIYADPVEFTRVNIKDYVSVFDGQDRVF